MTASVFEVGRLQETTPEHHIKIAVVVKVGEKRASRMAGQIKAKRGGFFSERAVSMVSQQHVFSEPHRDIDVVKTVAIDVRHGDALLLDYGDRRKIGMRKRLHALPVVFQRRFVVL